MKPKLKKGLIVIASFVIGLIIVLKILEQIPMLEVFETFKEGKKSGVIGFIITSIIIMILHTFRWKTVVQTTGIKVPFFKLFQYKIVGFGISFLTPAAKLGGEPVRAALLQRHGFKFRKALSTVAIDKLVDVSTTGVLFVVGIIVAITSFALPKDTQYLLVGIAVLFIGVIAWFYYQIISDKNLMLKLFKLFGLNKIKKLKHFEENIIEFDQMLVAFHKEEKDAFNKTILFSVCAWLLMFVEYKTALLILGITNISFPAIFLIITMMGAAYMVPIPLALGVLEAGQISMFAILKLKTAAGVGLSLLIRARDFAWSLIGIGILLAHGFNFKKAYEKSLSEGGLKPSNIREPKETKNKT